MGDKNSSLKNTSTLENVAQSLAFMDSCEHDNELSGSIQGGEYLE
jgi:hypothetical protein